MKLRFFVKLTVFVLPILLLTVVLLGTAVYSGEAMPLQWVIDQQARFPGAIYGPADNDRTFPYKMLMAQKQEPQLLVIGSSRLLQFRAGLANKQPHLFYNAAGGDWHLYEVSRFIEQIASLAPPKVIILGVDATWFNKALTDQHKPYPTGATEMNTATMVEKSQALWGYIFDESIALPDLFGREESYSGQLALGVNAVRYGQGYREDGSFFNRLLVSGQLDKNRTLQNHQAWFRRGEQLYTPGDTVDPQILRMLERLLQTAQTKNIIVVGFAPPYAPTFYAQLIGDARFAYIPETVAQVSALFAQYDMPFYDFSNAAWLDSGDAGLYDSWHASEWLSARIYMELATRLPEIFAPYTDVGRLQQTVAQAANTFHIFK